MPRYAVSHIDWFNYDLKTVIVTADNWKAALIQHPAVADMDWDDNKHSTDLEAHKRIAFDCDSMIEVVEIT